MENKKKLEKRMYFLVLGSLQGISKGIMCGHAALEYAYKYGSDPEYVDFIENWKTWVILNGGTTNSDIDSRGIRVGTMNQYLSNLQKTKTKHSSFKEPDLNHALTAICLVVDERVFNRVDYPDFGTWINKYNDPEYFTWGVEKQIDEYIKDVGIDYETYLLKELLNSKRLA